MESIAALRFETVARDLSFPEGPVAMTDGSVLVCELVGGTIACCRADGSVERIARPGGGPNGAAVGADGALYVCNNGGGYVSEEQGGERRLRHHPSRKQQPCIQRIDLGEGRVETLYTQSDGKPLIAPNDLVFAADGGLWFTDYGEFTATGRIYGSLHYAPANGAGACCVRTGILSPNGIGLSPDGTVLYVTDTYSARLWAFEILGPGALAPAPGRHCPGRLVAALSDCRLLDSLAVERDGRICVGTLEPGGVAIFAPEGDVELVAAPDLRITNLCFGGSDGRDMWMTAAESGTLLKVRWPRPGLRINFRE
jgi:gluconolactonase